MSASKIELTFQKIYEDGGDKTEYYLLHYLNQQKKISELSFQSIQLTLSELAKSSGSAFVVCAEKCDIPKQTLVENRITFRQLPQEISALPQDVQTEIFRLKPHYRIGKTSTARTNRYAEKKYDRIPLLVPKGGKEVIKSRSAEVGKSVNAYINSLIDDDLIKAGLKK